MTKDEMITWLEDCAKYFKNRATKGEDMQHWANVYNSENALKIAQFIKDSIKNKEEINPQPHYIACKICHEPIICAEVYLSIKDEFIHRLCFIYNILLNNTSENNLIKIATIINNELENIEN